MVPPSGSSGCWPRVLTAFRARATPKHVLSSCAGLVAWFRDVSKVYSSTLQVLCATCCARAGIATTVLLHDASNRSCASGGRMT